MKKFIILLMSITCLLLASCQSKDEKAADIGIADVVHDGHRYVVFHSKKGFGEAMQVLHSPNCGCNKTE